jgi:hypothetical protein
MKKQDKDNDEEESLAESFDRGQWRRVKDFKRENQRLRDAARHTFERRHDDGNDRNPKEESAPTEINDP